MITGNFKTINLIHPDKSDVKFELGSFPDGEMHIKLLDDIDHKMQYAVVCRIKSSDDLFVLQQIGDILNRHEVVFDLFIYYLMGARMDRVMNFNEAFSLKIIANVINDMKADKVYLFHPHSKAVYRLINNAYDMEENISMSTGEPSFNDEDTVICYPDLGASERYAKNGIANTMILRKKRDPNNKGAIVSMEIAQFPMKKFKNVIIVDDLCDAGGTFVRAAKLIKEKYPDVKLGIFVRHLVNQAGLVNLVDNFDHVYITNSYTDWDEQTKSIDKVNVWNVLYNFE